MTELCEIAAKWKTDKTGSYTTFYHTLFEHRRAQIKKVLEIGIGSVEAMKHVEGYVPGASLRMWRDYFPNAQVFGLDNDRDVLFSADRIKTRECDQSRESHLLDAAHWAGGDFDLILDDGSHQEDDQVLTAVTLMPFVKNGGLYIIEDANEPEKVSAKLPFEHAVVLYKYTPELTGRLILIRK